jgi:hypothetical protein
MMTFTTGFAVQQHAWSGTASGVSGDGHAPPASVGEARPVADAVSRPPAP